jgi:flavin-dependent dehydrogenase
MKGVASVKHVDVAVVGGGPAGAAAAITAAAAGLSVVVLDSPSIAAGRPGETLHPGVESVWRALGVADEASASGWLRHRGQWVEWGTSARFDAFGGDQHGHWCGYQAPRRALDELLLRRAAAAGAEVWADSRAIRPLASARRIDGVLTNRGPVSAAHVIDASGRRHWSARRLGTGVHRLSRPLLASWGYVTGRCLGRDGAPLLRADHQGWSWTARVGDKTYAWVRLSLGGLRRLQERPAEFAGMQSTDGPRGVDVTWCMARVTSAPGLLVVGDAARVLDPSSGSGVLHALVTGAVAARAVVDVRNGLLVEEQATTAYQQWLSRWFLSDVARLDVLYEIFPSWPGIRSLPPAIGAQLCACSRDTAVVALESGRRLPCRSCCNDGPSPERANRY